VSEPLTTSDRKTLATVLGINHPSDDREGPTQKQLNDLWEGMAEGTQVGLIIEWTVARVAATASKQELAIQLAKEIVFLLDGCR